MTEQKSERDLVAYLINNRTEFVTSKQLAKTLGISSKTIYRTIQKINKKYKHPVILSQRGLGYRIDFSAYIMEKKGDYLDEGEITKTPVERRNNILRRMLITAPERHTISNLFDDFYVSDSVIATDLRLLRRSLKGYHLVLKRKNDWIWVVGQENNIRSAINDLLITNDDVSISHFLQSNQRIHQQDASFVTRQINYLEEQLQASIPYPYDINLFSHLYIMIERYRNAGSLVDSNHQITLYEKEQLQNNLKIMEISKRVISEIGKYLHVPIPDVESFYLFQYLTSSRVNVPEFSGGGVDSQSLLAQEVTEYLIEYVSQQVTDVEVANQGLFENLIRHVKPLLNRLSNNIKVNNVLLSQIKLEYPQLFKIISKGTKQLEKRFSLNEIGDEEIGFLTVYFVQAIESHHKPIETVVACTTGLGTAQLLKTKLQNRFSELKIVATVASHDVNKELSLRPNVKLLISTFDFNLSEALGGVDQIVVSALFNDEDQDRLERKIIELSGDSEADK